MFIYVIPAARFTSYLIYALYLYEQQNPRTISLGQPKKSVMSHSGFICSSIYKKEIRVYEQVFFANS